MKLDVKTLTVIGSIITALGTATAGIVQATKNKDNNEALFRSYRVELVIIGAKLDVLMKKTGVTLDVDMDEIKKALTTSEPSWSLFPEALAQELPVQAPASTGVSIMIDGCQCICPDLREPVAAPAPPAPSTDQELFRKAIRERVRVAPKSIEAL